MKKVWPSATTWTTLATVVMAVATAIYAVYAGRQWKAINDQLPELHTSAEAAKDSAKAAKTAAEIAVLSERPWIKIVGVRTRGENPIIPALSFQGFGHGVFPEGNQQATLQLEVSLKNVGRSVGIVDVGFELFFAAWSSSHFAEQTLREEKRFCNSIASHRPANATRFILFPEEPFDRDGAAVATVSPDKINHIQGRGSGVVLPVVIVCVNYVLGDSPLIYQTRAMYEVFRVDDRTRFFEIGRDLPASKIVMERDSNADDAY